MIDLGTIRERRPSLAAFKGVSRLHTVADNPHVATLQRLLNDHFDDRSLNVESALQQCGLQRGDIYELFRAEVGCSMRCFLEKRRIEAAQWLLRHDDLDVATVSLLVGYTTPRVFRRAFKKCTGMTPGAYREKTSVENVR